MPRKIKSSRVLLLASGLVAALSIAASTGAQSRDDPSGPADQGPQLPERQDGNEDLGRDVFRFETFGNEGFWTDAVRLPEGIMRAKVTPYQALQLGLQVDSDMVDPATKAQLADELRRDPSGRRSRLMNDPAVTTALVKSGAVIGMAPKGDKVGASCALCHTITDASVFKSPAGGSIGKRIDGPANHSLNIGKIFATAANTRALYPVAQLQLTANKGKTLGRAPRGLTERSSEAEIDAYFSNPRFYPVGMFDDTFDGNGDPMHNSPLFEQDLAAPFGSEGTIARLDNFSNLVFTSLFDQTMLTTPGGRALLHKLGGAAGDEIADDYVRILAETRVTGYPYVRADPHPQPGSEDAPLGVRVDQRRLIALNAYLAALRSPPGVVTDAGAVARGRQAFAASGCTGCHNSDQSRPVPTTIHAMSRIFPGDRPVTLAQRMPPLNPVLDTPGVFFDDKMAIFNASLRGEKRGIAMPLLHDLARKPVFLHDDSVASMEQLFDPRRGPRAPHPFYLPNPRVRFDTIAYLKSLDSSRRR